VAGGQGNLARGGAARLIAAALLVLATVAVYLPVRGFEFLAYDDDQYVTGNRAVLGGLTREGAAWALQSRSAANWHPLTWISHMADVTLFGARPGPHHLVNLGIHAATAALLFLLLAEMSGAFGAPLLSAAVFALHPLHVESVAWVAERKDVLSGLLFVLALLAYLRHARAPGAARYAAVLLLSGLGLAAKPMLVTLPFVMLLLDFWPLGRLRPGGGSAAPAGPGRALLEKLPLLALSAASSAVTLVAQREGGGLKGSVVYPPAARLGNALTGYAWYLGKTLWPTRLAAYYPHARGAESVAALVGSAALLAALTAGALHAWRRRPHLAVGWLWFLGMLVPVIGLVQVGGQAVADRYSYLPMIGLLVALAWSAAASASRLPSRLLPLAAGAAFTLVVLLGAAARHQLWYWKDSVALFGRATAVNGEDARSWLGLGVALDAAGRLAEAEAALERSVRLNPAFADSRYDLGLVYVKRGRFGDAAAEFRAAVALNPGKAEAVYSLGLVSVIQGDQATARAQEQALRRLDPGLAEQLAGRIRGAP
jgi:tetratricopeptide (TPR) repeat protein